MGTTQLGYSNLITSPAANPNISLTTANLLSATIPKGVWVVEGNLYANISNSTSFLISLSTTSLVADSARININYIPSTTGSAYWASHITSVYILTTPTTVYLVGKLFGGTTATSTSNTIYIRYTKIG